MDTKIGNKKIKENIDLIIASGGVLTGIFIIYMSLVYGIHQQDIGGTIFIASVLYLLLRKRLLKTSGIFQSKPTSKFVYINNIVFFLALSLSLWFLYSILYYRPVIYFILVAVICTSVALEILYSNRKWTGLILIKILLIGIALYGGIYYEFEGIYGTDTRFHNAQAAVYIENGHISPSSYSYFPILHLLVSSTSILTSLNVHDSIFSSITFLFIFSVIFVFLIGQKLINAKAGLLAALMLVVGDYRITFGTAPIAMTLGIVFFTIILYLFIVNTPKSLCKRGIAFSLYIVLVLTHTIAGFVMFVTAISLIIVNNINKYLSNISADKFTIFWSTVIAFSVALFGYWMFAFQCPECESFFDQEVYVLYSGLTHDAELATGTEEKISPYIAPSYFEYLLDHLGYLIFLGTGIIGTYIWLKDKHEFKIPLGSTMVILFAFLYGFSLLGMKTILPTRWFGFVYVLLALVSAFGIFKLITLTNKKFRNTIIVITIFLMSFFMITSTISNHDNPLYYKEHSSRISLAHKTSELQGAITIHQVFNGTYGPLSYGPLTSIFPGYNMSKFKGGADITSLDYNLSEDEGKLYVLNKDAFKYPMILKKIGWGTYSSFILDDEFKIRLESNSNEIYDNGEVWWYVIKYQSK